MSSLALIYTLTAKAEKVNPGALRGGHVLISYADPSK